MRELKMTVSWDVKRVVCRLVGTNISEQPAASISSPHRLLPDVDTYLSKHPATFQNTPVFKFGALRT
jgi:hypothetical protein